MSLTTSNVDYQTLIYLFKFFYVGVWCHVFIVLVWCYIFISTRWLDTWRLLADTIFIIDQEVAPPYHAAVMWINTVNT